MINKNCYIIFLSFLVCVLLSACFLPQSAVFEDNVKLPETGWNYEQAVDFDFNIEDTNSLYNIYLNVRHTANYEFANCWVNVSTTYPDGTEKKAPINLPLADDSGKWYGNGNGDVISNEILIQQYAQLPQAGNYSFIIEQFMRVNPLNDILDIGLIVRKTEAPE